MTGTSCFLHQTVVFAALLQWNPSTQTLALGSGSAGLAAAPLFAPPSVPSRTESHILDYSDVHCISASV